MAKPRPDCVAFVYGNQDQKQKLSVLAQEANLSASGYLISMIEARYAELFGETPPSVLVKTPGS